MSDAFSFGAFLISYGTIRFSVNSWADPNHVFNSFPFAGHANLPLAFVSLMTFILIASSVTMVLAVHEGHKMNKAGVEKYMLWTILGGIAFLSCQAWEWTHLIGEGMVMTSNPFGATAFGWLFFCITGFHGFHVLTGVIINCIVLSNVTSGVYDRKGSYEMVEKCGLYWHFVDLVWVFVFMAFYLL